MPSIEFDVVVIARTLEENRYLTEVLLFPGISGYGDDLTRLQRVLRKRLQREVENSLPLDLHRRLLPSAPHLGQVLVSVKPPGRSPAWQEPVELPLHFVQWRHGDRPHIAYVPALGIETVVSREEELKRQVEVDVRFALLRKGALTSLRGLLQLSRSSDMRVDMLRMRAAVPTPKQRAAADLNEPSKPSRLPEVATDMTRMQPAQVFELEDVLLRIADSLSGRHLQSVLLVGPSGVGKTAAVYELARQREGLGLSEARFWATSGARLVSGMSGFGMWQQRCAELCREVAGQRAILYLGNLMELMEVGKSEGNTQGIGRFLAPHIACGELLAVAECTPEQVSVIEQEAPQLLAAFRQIQIDPPDRERCRRILRDYARALSEAGHATIGGKALDELERLHRRYATYSAQPGRAIQFLGNLLRDGKGHDLLEPCHVTRAFSRETGLPSVLLDDSVPLDLEDTRRWFCQRIMGQPDAVGLLVDLLATVKLELSRPGRPIASLLFIGPTGVGKTEMAKTLAQFLFGDRGRMIRFDMSEYADPVGVAQLVGGRFDSEGLLTAKVREQPFSVVLLDEFEKAHPAFFDLLLQVLGEGRLTDASGRLANFCNCVIIMTSNLGAASFQKGPLGFVKDRTFADEAKEHFVDEVRRHLRPELFNRIDRIVPFEPLSFETVSHIAARELEKIRRRDGILLRGVDLDIPDAVVEYVAMKGHDPRYGARPLQRVIEKELLVPLADGINRYPSDLALRAEVRVEEGHLVARVRARESTKARPTVKKRESRLDRASRAVRRVLARATPPAATALRRKVQVLERSSAVRDLRNSIDALERVKARLKSTGRRRHPLSGDEERDLEDLPRFRQLAQKLQDLSDEAVALEDRMLTALYHPEASEPPDTKEELIRAEQRYDELPLALYALQFKRPDYVMLAVFGEHTPSVMTLAAAYYSVARRLEFDVRVGQFHPPRKARTEGGVIAHTRVASPERFLEEPPEKLLGVSLGLTGAMAYPRFELERGTHAFIGHGSEHHCLVEASDVAPEKYIPPEGIERAGAIDSRNIRRRYNMQQKMMVDNVDDEEFHWSGRDMAGALKKAMDWGLGEALMWLMVTS